MSTANECDVSTSTTRAGLTAGNVTRPDGHSIKGIPFE